MLVLGLSFLAAAFFLGPELFSRWILSFVVPRRSVTRTRGDEVTSSILWAVVPLLLAGCWAWRHNVLRSWGGWRDVRLVFAVLYDSVSFSKYEDEFFQSFLRVAGMCSSLLWRLYLIVFVAAFIFNLLVIYFRTIRNSLKKGSSKRILAGLVLPKVSEWHILLSDMLLPQEQVFAMLDVLTKNGTLYQGRVQDRMLAADGSLLTLTLVNPRRFVRAEYDQAKLADSNVQKESFWRSIPSKLFVLIGSDIININVRYLPTSPAKSLDGLARDGQQGVALKSLLEKVQPIRTPDSAIRPASDQARPEGGDLL